MWVIFVELNVPSNQTKQTPIAIFFFQISEYFHVYPLKIVTSMSNISVFKRAEMTLLVEP